MTIPATFDPAHSGTHNARRIFQLKLADALTSIGNGSFRDKEIHDARKNIKAARTALRMLRDAVPSATYHYYNDLAAKAARPLGALRDSRALIDTLHMLRNGAGATQAGSYRQLEQALRRDWARGRKAAATSPAGLPRARALLGLAQRRAGRWNLSEHNWSVVGCGLRRVYARGRQGLSKSRTHPSVSSLHAWRKQVKYLRYQLKFLEPLWSRPIRELAHELHTLAEQLGTHHDLAVLADKVRANSAHFTQSRERRALLALIRQRQDQLQQQSLSLGRLIYWEKPAHFVQRMGAYWHEWRKQPSAMARTDRPRNLR